MCACVIFFGWFITFPTEMLQYKLINLIIYILKTNRIFEYKYYFVVTDILYTSL